MPSAGLTTALTAAALGLAAVPVVQEWRRTPRSPANRDQAPGRIALLPQGATHFDCFGPERGPVVVCVHGLTTPSFVWLGLTPYLVAQGYRVLTYDLYGRGHSSAPHGLQTPGFFGQQLEDLLTHEDITDPVWLIGYSMGGAIVTDFAARHPERVTQLSLLAPAGMGHELGHLARAATEWPLVGDWAFHMGYPRALRAGIAAERGQPGSVDGIGDMQLAELTRRGYLRAVLSSLRGTLRRSMEPQHRKLAALGTPITAVWGKEDAVIPLSAMGQLTQWNRSVRQVVIDGAGHGLTYTHTKAVADALLMPQGADAK